MPLLENTEVQASPFDLLTLGLSLLPVSLTLIIGAAVLWLAHYILLRDNTLGISAKLTRQMLLALLYVIFIISLIIALPIEKDTRNQILGLLGILLSGVIAFSSTTIVANIMSGLVLRLTAPFKIGDFIRVGEFFGRVSATGILDTEIQNEQSELIALTNSYLLATPIQVIRSSGTIISANLSLGYDIHHQKMYSLLCESASDAGLSDPFVQIIELGDFAISYRVSGLLSEVKSLLSSRSKLHACILDTLHSADIEIVSPSFMNQRRMDDKPPVIAKAVVSSSQVESPSTPEDLIFDKADAAQLQAEQEAALKAKITALEAQLENAEGEQKDALRKRIESRKAQLAQLIEAGKL